MTTAHDMTESANSVEMPKYRSHKVVHAVKIADTIEVHPDGSVKLHIADDGYAPISVESAVVSRHFPRPGDYLVVYEGGYRSISPGKVFEDGYTRV